eukprot:scaffold1248_cov393-Prasinococcus_capsulatus_cf.AAC.21
MGRIPFAGQRAPQGPRTPEHAAANCIRGHATQAAGGAREGLWGAPPALPPPPLGAWDQASAIDPVEIGAVWWVRSGRKALGAVEPARLHQVQEGASPQAAWGGTVGLADISTDVYRPQMAREWWRCSESSEHTVNQRWLFVAQLL